MIRFGNFGKMTVLAAVALMALGGLAATARDSVPTAPKVVFAAQIFDVPAGSHAVYLVAQALNSPSNSPGTLAQVSFYNGPGQSLTTFNLATFSTTLTDIVGVKSVNIEGDGTVGTADVMGKKFHVKITVMGDTADVVVTGDVSREVHTAKAAPNGGVIQFR